MRTAALVLLALPLAGCGPPGTTPVAPKAPGQLAPPPSSAGAYDDVPSTPQEIVEHHRSRLLQARVVREGDALRVTAWWRSLEGGSGRDAVTTSSDGFRSATYARWTQSRHASWFPQPEHVDVPALAGLLVDPVTSLVAPATGGMEAFVGGGDGATLLPFERLARSAATSGSWEVFDAPLFDGARAYTSGQLVLPDARLLVLLDTFSDDRPQRPADRHHGLWVSDGEDWSSFEPFLPSWDPAPAPVEDGHSALTSIGATAGPEGGVVWLLTWDSRLYVSTDQARTFRAIPARPVTAPRPPPSP